MTAADIEDFWWLVQQWAARPSNGDWRREAATDLREDISGTSIEEFRAQEIRTFEQLHAYIVERQMAKDSNGHIPQGWRGYWYD